MKLSEDLQHVWYFFGGHFAMARGASCQETIDRLEKILSEMDVQLKKTELKQKRKVHMKTFEFGAGMLHRVYAVCLRGVHPPPPAGLSKLSPICPSLGRSIVQLDSNICLGLEAKCAVYVFLIMNCV
ncbi:hypothetical protein AAMO2058_000509400 [Amorphochlora amoebiformis]